MAQLTTPSGITRTNTSTATANTITVTWSTKNTSGADTNYATGTTFGYEFRNKKTGALYAGTPAVPTAAAATVSGTTYTTTFTFATAADMALLDNYYVCVQAIPSSTSTGDSNSEWGICRFWVIGGSCTLQIGSASFDLSRTNIDGTLPGVYSLPATPANPIVITYADISSFATSAGVSGLPTSLPGIANLSATTLNINQLTVNTTLGLFSLDVTLNVTFSLFQGLSLSKVGFLLKRTDGSL